MLKLPSVELIDDVELVSAPDEVFCAGATEYTGGTSAGVGTKLV
jgi:hypothetical protein